MYLEKCRDFVTTPIEPLMLAVSVAIDAGVVISNFVLNGNSKELFNNRLQYMQVGAFRPSWVDETPTGRCPTPS